MFVGMELVLSCVFFLFMVILGFVMLVVMILVFQSMICIEVFWGVFVSDEDVSFSLDLLNQSRFRVQFQKVGILVSYLDGFYIDQKVRGISLRIQRKKDDY